MPLAECFDKAASQARKPKQRKKRSPPFSLRLSEAERERLLQEAGPALLGRSRIANNLNQLAHAANIGALPITPETEEDLRETLRDVKAIRHLLMAALGLKPEDSP